MPRKVTIIYNTIAGEEIEYVFEVLGKEKDRVCKEQYFCKGLLKPQLISNTKAKPVSWVYIRHWK